MQIILFALAFFRVCLLDLRLKSFYQYLEENFQA